MIDEMRLPLFATLLLAILVLAGPASAQERLRSLRKDDKIVPWMRTFVYMI